MSTAVHTRSSGIVSPLGFSTAENFAGVLEGRSGLQYYNGAFTTERFCASVIPEEQVDASFAKLGDPRQYTKLEKMSILALSDAIARAGLDVTAGDVLLIYCTTKGNIDRIRSGGSLHLKDRKLYLHDLVRTVSDFFGFRNAPLIVSNACISGVEGIIMGRHLLRAGRYRHAVVCGGDIVSEFTLSGFHSLNALADSPCLPFDAARKGINLGEAAACVILSSGEAVPSGSTYVGEGATSNDAHHISAPSKTGEGLYRAISRVLEKNSVSLDFISMHGTGTLYNDEAEALAVYRAGLGDKPIHSLKGYFGHTLGAAGVMESILAMYSMQEGCMIPSKGFTQSGVSSPIHPIERPVRKPMQACLKTASGFGGCNAAILFSTEQMP